MKKINRIKLVFVTVMVFGLVLAQGLPAASLVKKTGQSAGFTALDRQPAAGAADRRVRTDRPQPEYKDGEIIFQMAGSSADEAAVLKKYKMKVLRRDRRLGYILAKAEPGTDMQRLAADLAKEKSVNYAQLNYIYKPLGKPNDLQYSRQWAMAKINAEQGWSVVRPRSEVTVAILDTGVDINHPDLKGKLVPGTNTVNPLKSTRDSEGHGTHVAGIVGAVMNNGLGVAGVAGIPQVKIMPVKVFDDWGGSDISISDGIIWAADHGARVMNMSFGSFFESKVLNDAINYAYDKGVVMVAAAGNWASWEISYPAALTKVIAVSAVDKNDNLADYSSYGPEIDVAAPGEEIYSTVWNPYKGSTYTEMSGTSMASPMVAGLAALLLAQDPALSNDDVRQIIEVSAKDLGDPGWDPEFGHGLINVHKALTTSLANIDDANSTVEEAVYLSSGLTVEEKIDYGTDVDWFKVHVPDKHYLQVEVLPAGKVSPGVEIYDSAEAVIASWNTPDSVQSSYDYSMSYIPFRSLLKVAEAVYGTVGELEEGYYYIKVFGNHFRWTEENYSITARLFSQEDLAEDLNEPNDSDEEAKSIAIGTTVTGAIINPEDEDWFRIDLSSRAYRIHVAVPAGLNLAIEVMKKTDDSSGEDSDYDWFYQIIDEKGQGEDEDKVIILPEKGGGTYYLRVFESSGAAVNDSYSLTVTDFRFTKDKYEDNNTWQSAAAIRIGEDILANSHQEDDEDWYEITTNDTGILKISFQRPSDVWYGLYFYKDPEGEPEGHNYWGWEGEFYNDRYWDDNPTTTFEYKVFPGKYYINLHNSYSISAENYTFKTEFTRFDFVDRELNDLPSKAVEITAGSARQGTLHPNGDIDFYVFNVENPQPFLVYLTPPAGLNTVAVVMKEMEYEDKDKDEEGDKNKKERGRVIGVPGYDDQGPKEPEEPILETVAEINSGGKDQPDTGVFIPQKPGKYYIAITALEGRSQGRYTVSVKPFKAVPDAWEDNNSMAKAKVLASGVAVKPTFMGTEDEDWFKIYIPAKGILGLSLAVPNDIDGVVEVYDTKGKYMGIIDHSMAGEEERGTFAVRKPGYYYLKVYDYLGNSSVQPYTLTARYLETTPPKISTVRVNRGTVTFKVSKDCRVFVKVLNNSNSFVAMILDGAQVKKGKVTAAWDGTDASGRKAYPGTYKLKIVAIDSSGNMSQPVYSSIKI